MFPLFLSTCLLQAWHHESHLVPSASLVFTPRPHQGAGTLISRRQRQGSWGTATDGGAQMLGEGSREPWDCREGDDLQKETEEQVAMLLITTFCDPSPNAELLPVPLTQSLWTQSCDVKPAYSRRCGFVKTLPSQIKLLPVVVSTLSRLGLHPTAPLFQSRTPDSCMTSSISTTLQRERNIGALAHMCPCSLPDMCPRRLSHLLTHCARNLLSGSATGTAAHRSVK